MESKLKDINNNLSKNKSDKSTTEETAEEINQLKNKAEKVITQSAEEISKKYSEVQESIVNYVHENPWKSLGFSLLTGVLLTILIKK